MTAAVPLTRAQRLALALMAIGISAIYLWRLGSDPIYLSRDEILAAIESQNIARTGHGTDGTWLPFYVRLAPDLWASPIRMYTGALIFRMAHISDYVSRMPSALGGLAAIAMMYVAGQRVFRSAWYGMLAAALLAVMPAEFLASRFKIESHYPLIFVAGWLWCARRYEETRRRSWLAAAGATLGLGIYSYHAGPIMMPLYIGITLWLLWRLGDLRADRAGLLIGIFIACALPWAIFVLARPDFLQGELTSYRFYDRNPYDRLQGIARLLTWPAVVDRINSYYLYFSPPLLFFSGGVGYTETTQRAGGLLVPFAVLLPVGAYRILTSEPPTARLYLIGLLTGPLAGALIIKDGVVMRRALFLLPFAAIVATYGVRQLLDSRARWQRFGAIALVLALAVQFGDFYRDFLGDYRNRSAFWFGGNLRAAFEAAIDAETQIEGAQPVFLSSAINRQIDSYWMFYLLKHDRTDLATRTTIFDVQAAGSDLFPPGAIVLADAESAGRFTPRLLADLTELARAQEPDGTVSFYVWSAGARKP